MKYKINYKAMLETKPLTMEEALRDTRDMIRAIFYLLEAGEFCLTNEGYKKLDDEGKKFFIAFKE